MSSNNKTPSYIKIIYIMILKNNKLVKDIMHDNNDIVHDCACEVCGSWEGYTYAMNARNEVMGFINRYIRLT